jgi:hypothetical protein
LVHQQCLSDLIQIAYACRVFGGVPRAVEEGQENREQAAKN